MIQDKDEQRLSDGEGKKDNSTKKQEQSDPQLTELRGFVNPDDDLEPKLSDGKKSPDKAAEEYEGE